MITDLNVMDIKKYVPLVPPSLLLDYINEVEPGKYAKGYKNFTYGEWFFRSHFPGDPNVPSAIMIDAMSQILLMTFLTIPGNEGKITACLRIDKVEFKRKVIPGDTLDLTAYLRSYRNGIGIGTAEGSVLDQLACRAEFVIGIPEEIQKLRPNKGEH